MSNPITVLRDTAPVPMLDACKWLKLEDGPHTVNLNAYTSAGFALTTLYGQLISVCDYAQAALLILGGSTVAAMLVGYIYGRGKRVWCRYLCSISGVFGLLAKLAPLHFRVDEARWQDNPAPHLPPPNCAPLLAIRRMRGASDCHACGRCSGQRHTVQLIARSSNAEIPQYGQQSNPWDERLRLFGVIGLAMGAFQWSVSPWFIQLKITAADWLLAHEQLWALQDNAPWWLLTHYPAFNDSFTWLDGGVISAYILGSALLLGGSLHGLLHLTIYLLGGGRQLARQLALCLTPLGACGFFLGLSATTVKLLRQEGLQLLWAQPTRAGLLLAAMLWSLQLAWQVSRPFSAPARALLLLSASLAVGLIGYGSWLQFCG